MNRLEPPATRQEFDQQRWMLKQARQIARRSAKSLNELASLGGSRSYSHVAQAAQELAEALLELWPRGDAPDPVVGLAKSAGVASRLYAFTVDWQEDSEEWEQAWIDKKILEQREREHKQEVRAMADTEPDSGFGPEPI